MKEYEAPLIEIIEINEEEIVATSGGCPGPRIGFGRPKTG